MTCFSRFVMGCRSSKHQNSVADENESNKVANGGGLIGSTGEDLGSGTSAKKSTGGLFAQKNLKLTSGRAGHASPINRSERPFTQSQVDFFQMLDTKIDAGKDYASEDDVASSVR